MPLASKKVLDWKLFQNSETEYKAEWSKFFFFLFLKDIQFSNIKDCVETCFYILFGLILCVFLKIKIATGSTGLIKNFQEVRKYTWKGIEVSR